jgi:oligopeptidase B
MTDDRLTPAHLGVTARPPVADRQPTTRGFHGLTIHDDYPWLKDESYPVVDDENVLDYLRQENAYFEAVMAPHE